MSKQNKKPLKRKKEDKTAKQQPQVEGQLSMFDL